MTTLSLHRLSILTSVLISSTLLPIAAHPQPHLHSYRITSRYTSFPDSARAHGHFYDSVLYNARDHYEDSSVLIITPERFHATRSVDLIFWFHGWRNNIDTALVKYGLSRQFGESGVNAVLVLAETAKNSPDSYGGKLEQPRTFESLVKDVLNKLKLEKIIPSKSTPGHILLMGHSGAYRVMAGILDNVNMPVNQVVLFDALYGKTETYIDWIRQSPKHQFIDLYTDQGGTFDETKNMIHQLAALQIETDTTEETALQNEQLQKSRTLFIHTPHEHDFIIQHPDNFKRFLENNSFLRKY